MTYAEPLSNQVLMFIRSIGPGVLIGLIYDVIFTFFRTFSHNRVVIIAADLTFSIVATLVSFFYMIIYNSGTIRLNIIIAEIIGAVAIHISMGKYVAKLVEFIAKIIGKAGTIIFYPFIFLLRKVNTQLKKIPVKRIETHNNFSKVRLQGKKIMNIIKIHLKN